MAWAEKGNIVIVEACFCLGILTDPQRRGKPGKASSLVYHNAKPQPPSTTPTLLRPPGWDCQTAPRDAERSWQLQILGCFRRQQPWYIGAEGLHLKVAYCVSERRICKDTHREKFRLTRDSQCVLCSRRAPTLHPRLHFRATGTWRCLRAHNSGGRESHCRPVRGVCSLCNNVFEGSYRLVRADFKKRVRGGE